jgi:hypothetical protein
MNALAILETEFLAVGQPVAIRRVIHTGCEVTQTNIRETIPTQKQSVGVSGI